MKKLSLLVSAILMQGSLTMSDAKPVSCDEAGKIAISWYKYITSGKLADYAIDHLFTGQAEGQVTYYAFSFHQGGFVIVSADDDVAPILGYSTEAAFGDEVNCPAVKAWIDGYSRQITSLRETGESNREAREQWDAILKQVLPEYKLDVPPLLATTWGQGCYYNAQCPVDSEGPCTHVVTGCGPTAMAQILKYYDFPPHGIGSHAYFHPIYGELSADFSETDYAWTSMPDHLYTYNISVATLMHHAGISVNASYSPSETTCLLDDIKYAFIEYFNYFPEIGFHSRNDYPDDEEWKDLIKTDLDEGRPVFYHGVGPETGHYFICDGYSTSDNMFHFNWGWNSTYNGWFLINDLTPGNIDFNTYNAIFTNLKPYNPDLVVRISNPEGNELIPAGEQIDIEGITVVGDPDKMELFIDDMLVAQGSSEILNYTWSASTENAGSHSIKVWSIEGDDSVYYSIILNVSDEWVEQSSGFEVPLRAISDISAVDSTTAWAIARDGIDEWYYPIQEFTRTSDGGATWISGTVPGCEGLLPGSIFAFSGDKAFVSMFRLAGDNPQGIYVTTDAGLTWTHQATASFSNPFSFPDCIHFFDENNGWCLGDPVPQSGALEFEIYTTLDGGENWTIVPPENKPNPLSSEYGLLGYSAINDTIWFGTTKGRIYRSTDRGSNYTVTAIPGLEESWIIPVFRNGSHGLVHDFFNFGGKGKLYETYDGGLTWAEIATEGKLYRSDLAYVPGTENTWVSSGYWSDELGEGASVSFDGGHSWTEFAGTNGTKFRYMSWINSHCGWAGGYNENDSVGGIYKFCGELNMPVGFEEEAVRSSQFAVRCFPNPAGGSLQFAVRSSQDDYITLKIYDLQGREVATALERKLQAGEHTFRFDLSAFPAGIYLLRSAAGGQTEIQKLIIHHYEN